MTDVSTKVNCGVEVTPPLEISSVLKAASIYGFEFVCVPIFHPRFKREFIEEWTHRSGPITRPDLVLTAWEWNNLVAGKVSPYINTELEFLKTQGKFTLEQEFHYCNHLDLSAVIVPVRNSNTTNLARIVHSNFKNFQIWIELGLISDKQEASIWRSDIDEEKESTWEWWNNIRSLCNYDKRLGLILKVSKNLPDQKELDRWIGEPIKAVVLLTSTFLTNKKGYPVLPKAHQTFIRTLLLLDVQVLIRGNNHHKSMDCYQKYIDHLWRGALIQISPNSTTLAFDEEALGFPLTPLTDDLVSYTYELFERDSCKYREYAKALTAALKTDFEENAEEVINIMVVGAGRGPLVEVALKSAKRINRKVKVYAVEKNPQAVVSLQEYQQYTWHDSVEIIPEDVRFLNFPQKIDILLSELLGSFADNELSPELLDKAQKFLKEGGISIPESYTSFVCPIQSSKVYGDLKDKSEFENLFVSANRNKYLISPSKPVFSFHHPNNSDVIDNTRYKKVTFEVEQNAVLHGFNGYFESTLYKEVKISIVPETFTKGLRSWCPVIFPLKEPVQLKAGDTIEAHFWRLNSKKNVWYEWTITKPKCLPIHNSNGRSSNMSLH